MKKILYILIPLALIALVVFKLKTNKETAQNKVYHYDKEKPVSVQVDTIKYSFIENELNYAGTFEPNKETKLSAEVQGKINEVLVDIGTVVSKGQELIHLDNSLLKLQLQSVDVQIEGFEADVKRYTVLTGADAIQGVQLEKALLGLKTAKVQKATLQEQINKTTIRAPFNGLITAKLTEEGAFAAPGIPLIQLTDISDLKFTINVSENDLTQFRIHQAYPVYADVYSENKLSAKTIMIGSKANMGSSYPVQFLVKNTRDAKIKSGMFGKIKIKQKADMKGIIISASAITGADTDAGVYKVKNGKAILSPVSISQKIKNKVVIAKGLDEGDVIVTSGFIHLFDGANVTLN